MSLTTVTTGPRDITPPNRSGVRRSARGFPGGLMI